MESRSFRCLIPRLATLQYSTFLGGINSDTGYGISSDSSGNAYVTGQTASTDFPITQGALLETRANSTGAGFVSKINPVGNGLADLVYSSYYGGQAANNLPNQDSGRGIAVSGTNAYVTGQMTSPDMPVSATAYQAALGASGATNAYVADLPLTPTISVVPSSLNFGTQLVGYSDGSPVRHPNEQHFIVHQSHASRYDNGHERCGLRSIRRNNPMHSIAR